MTWGSLDAFLAMGGNGFFVWASFGGVLLALTLEWVLLRVQARQVVRGLRQGWRIDSDEV